jgi:hypothetical protein
MARRSRATLDMDGQVAEIKRLLDTFLERLDQNDLREQVISLIPAFHSLRDLGSGLIVGQDVGHVHLSGGNWGGQAVYRLRPRAV